MSLTNLISENLNFAISQLQVSLTQVTASGSAHPTNTQTYLASRQDVEESFEIYEDGREVTIDTKFYINKSSYSPLPTKGMLLSDGTTTYKVMGHFDDSVSVTRRLDCNAQNQR